MDIYSIENAQGETLSKSEINELLQEMGISDEAIKEGTSDAIEADAQKLGISNFDAILTEKIKETGVSGASDSAKEDYNTQLEAKGIPTAVISKGQAAIEDFAFKNNIILPQATGTALNFKS